MQGRISQRALKTSRGSYYSKKRVGSRMVGGVLAMVGVVTAVSTYAFYRVDRLQENVSAVNDFYLPVLKHINLLNGKWSAYQRSFEQTISFRKWGAGTQDRSPIEPKLSLKRLVEPNLAELSRRVDGREMPETAALKAWIDHLTDIARREAMTVAEIEGFLKHKHYAEAAAVYTTARSEHLAVSQELAQLGRNIENKLVFVQLSMEQELRGSQSVMLALLAASILFSLIVLLRLRRWLLPIAEWTGVAQEIALKGISRDVKFPQITGGMPAELSLLTREFTRMGTTVLERERTIHQQKQKLEQLNSHLKEQNLVLRRLGSLNERVLNSMSSGLLVVNAEGKVEQFNERYCELFGAERRKLMGTLAEWPGDLADRARIQIAGRALDVRVQPLSDGAGNAGRLLLFEDVTHMVEAQAKLEHARKLVLAGDLSAQVAHEVRNPLNSMSLQLEMLEEDASDEQARARVRAIAEQVDRLERITRRYLDVGRTVSSRKESVSLHSLLEKCLRFLAKEIQGARVLVQLDLSAPEHVIPADGDAISQVIFNLVRNAIEAMRDVSGRRALTILTESGDGMARVRVADTGPGLPFQLKSRVFEPFVTDKAGGHGLGLSVSRQICIEHGGDLKALDSESGAVFELSLPLLARPLPKVREESDAPNPGC